MQDENVACHDLGKASLECAVGRFGTSQLEPASRFSQCSKPSTRDSFSQRSNSNTLSIVTRAHDHNNIDKITAHYEERISY